MIRPRSHKAWRLWAQGDRWSSLPGIADPYANAERAEPDWAGHQLLIVGFPGEDIFHGPDPSQTQGVNQGAAHIHDLTFLLDSRIDATLPWQIVNDAGTTAKAALYRPIAQKSGVSSNPLAPGWFQGPNAITAAPSMAWPRLRRAQR